MIKTIPKVYNTEDFEVLKQIDYFYDYVCAGFAAAREKMGAAKALEIQDELLRMLDLYSDELLNRIAAEMNLYARLNGETEEIYDEGEY